MSWLCLHFSSTGSELSFASLPLADALNQMAAADATLSLTQRGIWSYLDGLNLTVYGPMTPQPLQASGLHYKIDEAAVLQAWRNKCQNQW